MSALAPLFIIATGPLIGSHIPHIFTTRKFTQIVLFSPSQSTLTASSDFITAAAPSVAIHTFAVDVTDTPGLTYALQRAVRDIGAPEVVVYNAGRASYGIFGEYKEEDIVEDFKILNLGLYTTSKVLLPCLQVLAREEPASRPSFFVISSPIIHQPFVPIFSLNMAQAAQANLVKLLTERAKDEVHIELVTVEDPIRKQEPANPKHISTKPWELWGEKMRSTVNEVLVQ
ncbi:hypothetical protein DSL72_005100 [Monilinia vaccinii-corymbosi]|uniref:Uncharacterized protein n=1 Tax=Monilinia vaccinii-corymbosi TaxID=61207 RepID=A0A8A3PE96_9HELO|nr:hypothetical protein DSL72_005100 [Monilinia vaccinii-corymbosi]